MSEPSSQHVGRSPLLTGLSYPLLAIGIFCLLAGIEGIGMTFMACATFLIGVNELCLYMARSRVPQENDTAEIAE
ncbi:hypothetical protein [Brachybacterium sacelli]|uniref:Uncharacterized protein n=1 Tax=Brachybacterium sacelli TaxID=173364 RepID=A0ABS4WZB0_9MICO|nr:hypothetical protein [Brachybacterium sacelli]MBP2381308.1 hypothetical protein [Brachybacterium sacelli]